MTWLLAVDPGQAACGAALFFDGRLRACSWVSHPGEHSDELDSLRTMAREVVSWLDEFLAQDLLHAHARLHFVCEWPKVYYGGKGQADPDDLMPLCGIDGALAALLPAATCKRVRPKEWGASGKPVKPKGLPWPPYTVEVKLGVSPQLGSAEAGRLDAEERRIYRKETYGMGDGTRHNVADAVAIGLHELGRGIVSARRRVYPR